MLANIKKLSNSKFVRNVAIVATGTAGAQGIAMVFMPIITRLYGPEAFGLLGAFMAILAIVTPIAALTYPSAMVLPKSDRDALGLAKLSTILAFVMASLLAIILLFTGEALAELLRLQSVAGFLLLIPVAMLFAAFHQILQQWLIRKKQFKITARVAVLQSLTLNSAKAGIGWFHPVGAVLIILATLGNALHALLLWLGIKNQPGAYPNKQQQADNENREMEQSDLKALAIQYRGFPVFRAPQIAINALSQSVPVLMLASFFGPAAAGFYTLGKTVMGLPSILIGKSVGSVFYPRVAEAANNKEDLFQLVKKATMALALSGLLPFALVVAFGPWLFSIVFGAEWIKAGEYAQWMAIWIYSILITVPTVQVLPTVGMQGFHLIFTIIKTTLRLSALAVGFIYYQDDYVSVALFCVVGFVTNIFLIGYVLYKLKRKSFHFN